MKTAVLTDWLATHGGAEAVTYSLARAVGATEIWTISDDRAAGALPESRLVWPWFGALPQSRPLVALASTVAWRHGNFRDSEYDRVVSSHHLQVHTAATTDVPHYSYVHTPARYAWYPEIDQRANNLAGAALSAWIKKNDVAAAHRVYSYAANSETTAARIRECWDREAVVIHPPVDVEFFSQTNSDRQAAPEPYLLAAGRWVAYKQFDKCIEIANAVGMRLVIAGAGPEEVRLRALAAESRAPVQFIMKPSRASLRALYRHATVLLSPGNEDFGIVPVEAMATGTAVVGPASGGLNETVIDGISGVLMHDTSMRAWSSAIEQAAGLPREETAGAVKRFSSSAFGEQVCAWLESP